MEERREGAKDVDDRHGEKNYLPSPPALDTMMFALLTLLNHFKCYFLCVYQTVNHAPYRVGGYMVKLPSRQEERSL